MSAEPVLGAIEAGGTKIVCGYGRSLDELLQPGHRAVVATEEDPEASWANVRRFFAGAPRLAALGVASFGPVNLEDGTIAGTPKSGWEGFSWPRRAAELTDGPLGLDSDVDAAALAEWRRGAARGATVAVYVTVGTGIGGGCVLAGRVLRGRRHPEMGHLRIGRRSGDGLASVCRFHDDCWEGLASGEALRRRYGQPAEALPADHPGWALEADYLGIGVADLLVTLAPDRLVLGGGVLGRPGLLAEVRRRAAVQLNGYAGLGAPDRPSLDGDGPLGRLVVAPGLGGIAGLVGAFELAADRLLGRGEPAQPPDPPSPGRAPFGSAPSRSSPSTGSTW